MFVFIGTTIAKLSCVSIYKVGENLSLGHN